MSGPESVDHTCNICLDTLGANGGVTTLLCGHPFCRTCLSRWQATSHLCPVCRTDQRTLEGNNTGDASASDPDDFEHIQGPSLASILDLMGQLLAREGAHPGFSVEHGDPHSGSGVSFAWSSSPEARPPSHPAADTSATAISELQSTVQFVMARIESLERRPLYWNAQISELQQAGSQLDACRHGTAANPALIMQRVQQYTDSVNAQLDEFLTQEEAREQHRRQAEARRRQSEASQPSAPAYASAPPTQTGVPADASSVPSSTSGSGTGSGGWSWKWGWGPAPVGTLPDDSSSVGASTQTAQSSGIGAGAAAGAAAALATVGAAAAAAYRRMAGSTAQSGSDSASEPASAPSASSHAQQQPAAQQSSNVGSAGSAQQSSRFPAAGGASGSAPQSSRFTNDAAGASTGPSASASQPTPSEAGAGPPVQGIYDAVRGIFDRHVSPDSSLGRWGEVARHLNDLHGQMNEQDSQRQDAGRLLASAVYAYGAYRRATASSANQ